jgi:hypothetical protein
MLTNTSAGWIVRADKLGLRVSSRPGRFGDEIYFVKSADGFVKVVQNKNVGRKLDTSEFTPSQLEIVTQLQNCGLIC